MHDEHIRHLADHGDRRKALHAVIGKVLVQILVRDGGADMTQQQGPPVRRRTGHDLRADIAAPSGPVLDGEGPARQLAENSGHDARHEVGRAAGSERHDDARAPVAGTKILSVTVAHQAGRCESTCGQSPGDRRASANSDRHLSPPLMTSSARQGQNLPEEALPNASSASARLNCPRSIARFRD